MKISIKICKWIERNLVQVKICKWIERDLVQVVNEVKVEYKDFNIKKEVIPFIKPLMVDINHYR